MSMELSFTEMKQIGGSIKEKPRVPKYAGLLNSMLR